MDKNIDNFIQDGLDEACLSARKYIVENRENLSDFNYYYIVRLNPKLTHEGTGDSEPNKTVSHLHTCSMCEYWLDHEFPQEYVSRPYRLAHYCCAGMFVAVEEYEIEGDSQAKYYMHRGEDASWLLGGRDISYCPWCGEKLPNRPFRKLEHGG